MFNTLHKYFTLLQHTLYFYVHYVFYDFQKIYIYILRMTFFMLLFKCDMNKFPCPLRHKNKFISQLRCNMNVILMTQEKGVRRNSTSKAAWGPPSEENSCRLKAKRELLRDGDLHACQVGEFSSCSLILCHQNNCFVAKRG